MKNGRQTYEVLELLPKSTILLFYVKSIFIGSWVLAKWSVFLLWNSISKARNNNRTKNSSLDYDGYHDKPPSILVDNKIGRHSYVKLKKEIVAISKFPDTIEEMTPRTKVNERKNECDRKVFITKLADLARYLIFHHICLQGSKGVKLHYVEAGSSNNSLVLLLHGFPDCWLGWRNQIGDLSRYFRVVALDMKGFNDSDKPLWSQLYTPKTICDELRQFIYSLGCSSATIIGHDIGAVVGWFFAHTNPDNIDRFICVSAPHPNLIWESLHPKAVMNTSWLQFIQLPIIPELDHANQHSLFLEKCLKSATGADNSKAVINLKKSVDSNFDIEFNFNVLDTYKYVFSRRSDWSGPFNYFRNFPLYKIKEGNTIRSPVLIITGNSDERCRLECMVKSTDFCENFIVKIIEGAGHSPHQQVPEEFNKIILNFLIGKRALPEQVTIDKNTKGIMGRMLGAVTSGVKIGTSVLDSVQQRTNNVINSALY